MAQYDIEYDERLAPLLKPWRRDEDFFAGLREQYDEEKASIGGLRRRRRRAANMADQPLKTVSLIEKDGVLVWCDDVPELKDTVPNLDLGRRRRRFLRRAGFSVPQVAPPPLGSGPLLLTKTFPVLAPNKIVAAVGRVDQRLNPALGLTLNGKLRRLRANPNGSFFLDDINAGGPFSGRTLVFVHGTFSNGTNMLGEFAATPEGRSFLGRALGGPKAYNNVLFFEHATLAVSPVINALELGRLLANASGQIDVIAHSRGGLIVRWWLEAFGKSLNVAAATPVRVVLAGSPIRGTSLAAPDKLQEVLNLVANIGAFAKATMNLVGVANPFMWAAEALVEVVVSATGALARTPLLDGVVVLVPGLAGQSAVDNNHEINRLRLGPCAVTPQYFAVKVNFETADPEWKFWQYFRKEVIADAATNRIFPGPNDLVVDTDFMTDFGVPNLGLAGPPCDFQTRDDVWHCNYFRQKPTIDYIIASFP